MCFKRKSLFILFIIICLSLTACCRLVHTESEIFTQEEIKSAYDVFCDYFEQNHHKDDGYKLKKVWYAGDKRTRIEYKNYSDLGYDKIIVFYTNDVLGGEMQKIIGKEASKDLQWTYILGKHKNGDWEYITGGFFDSPSMQE